MKNILKKTFYYLLQATWCLPQNIIGAAIWLTTYYRGNTTIFSIEKGRFIALKSTAPGSIGIGMFIGLTSRQTDLVKHEYGHTIQSLILGPLFLFVIGIPSLLWASLGQNYRKRTGTSYYAFYPEKWANKLGGVER